MENTSGEFVAEPPSDFADIVENVHDAYQHRGFRQHNYSVLMTGPSGSADIGGTTVHPAQGVMTVTVIMWPRGGL